MRRRTWFALLLSLVSLTACSGAPTATQIPLTVAPPTVTLTVTATAVPAFPAAVTPPPPTATPTVLPPTVTPAPTATSALSATPTAIRPTATPTAALYTANFATWFAGEESVPYPSRSGFDPATGEYSLALTDPTRQYGAFRYGNESPRLADFQLDIDAQAVAGPAGGSYGVVFRAVPPGPGEQTVAQQLFFVTTDGKFFLTQIDASGRGTSLAPPTSSGAIKPGTTVNHLTVVCKSDRVTLAINGQTVGSYRGVTAVAGGFGVGVSNPRNPSGPAGMGAVFTNLHVSAAP